MNSAVAVAVAIAVEIEWKHFLKHFETNVSHFRAVHPLPKLLPLLQLVQLRSVCLVRGEGSGLESETQTCSWYSFFCTFAIRDLWLVLAQLAAIQVSSIMRRISAYKYAMHFKPRPEPLAPLPYPASTAASKTIQHLQAKNQRTKVSSQAMAHALPPPCHT